MKTTLSILGLVTMLLPSSGYCWYNPQTGRWLSRDPIGESGGLNLHAFPANAPVGAFDRLGLCGGGDDNCSCKAIEVTFDPADDDKRFKWGIVKGPVIPDPRRIGNNIKVSITVEGSPEKCKVTQDERSAVEATGFDANDPGAIKPHDAVGINNPIPWGAFHGSAPTYYYWDEFGKKLAAPGYYFMAVSGKIVFKCAGTDASAVQKTLQIKAFSFAERAFKVDDSQVLDHKLIEFKLQ